jgi:DNA-binding MarR family transcriptional regulator
MLNIPQLMIDEKLFMELYEHGYVDTTIAMRMGIPLSQALKFRIDQGLLWNKPLATFKSEQELVKTIQKLVKKGMKDSQIAYKTNVAPSLIGAYRRAFGLRKKEWKDTITPEQRATIKRLHKKDCQITEIAQELEMDRQRVYVICREMGLDTSAERFKRIRESRAPSIDPKRFKELHDSGYTLLQISKELGISINRVSKYYRESGLSHYRSLSDEEKKRIMELYDQDYLIEEIARDIGWTYSYVSKYLQEMGIKKSLHKRAFRIKRERYLERTERQILEYLTEHGPTNIKVLMHETGYNRYRVQEMAKHKKVERIYFQFPRSSPYVRHKRVKIGPFLALKGDERIVSYIANKLDMKDLLKPYIDDLSEKISRSRAKTVMDMLVEAYLD